MLAPSKQLLLQIRHRQLPCPTAPELVTTEVEELAQKIPMRTRRLALATLWGTQTDRPHVAHVAPADAGAALARQRVPEKQFCAFP